MEDFKHLQKFHGDCGRRVLVPNIPMEVSKSIWRHLSLCFRNVRKVSVEKTWEHNPCGVKRGAEGHLSLSLKTAGTIMIAVTHVPPSEATSALNGFYNPECCFYVWTTTSHWWDWDRLHEQQTQQNYGAAPRSGYPQTTRIKAQRPKKTLQDKEKVWWNEETCRTQDRCKTMVGDVLPVTELQSRVPKHHRNC